MKAMLKNKLSVALTLAVALFASYSCEDKEAELVFPGVVSAEKTALDVMLEDPDYAQFLQVVELCGAGCADSLFNQSRVYTIFAPVGNSFDIAAIEERIANGDREGVFKQYVKSHIANNRHAAIGDMDKKMVMLNDKAVSFSGTTQSGYTFGGTRLVEYNIQVKNGIIHKIANPFDYKPSIWESLKNINSISSFWDFCATFTKKEFDPWNSILGDREPRWFT